ncbi:hypothetical protein [Nocardia sp. NPDC003963]
MTETDADDIRSVCDTCHTGIHWIDCPTGGWWAHDIHPADHHDAVTVMEVEEDETIDGRLYTIGIRGGAQ